MAAKLQHLKYADTLIKEQHRLPKINEVMWSHFNQRPKVFHYIWSCRCWKYRLRVDSSITDFFFKLPHKLHDPEMAYIMLDVKKAPVLPLSSDIIASKKGQKVMMHSSYLWVSKQAHPKWVNISSYIPCIFSISNYRHSSIKLQPKGYVSTWSHCSMEMLSTLLTLSEENPMVTSGRLRMGQLCRALMSSLSFSQSKQLNEQLSCLSC